EEVGDRLKKAQTAWAEASAEELKKQLRAVPYGDLDGFGKGKAKRADFAEAFPGVKERLHEAETAWGRATASTFAGRIKKVQPGDVAALVRVRQEYAKLVETVPTAAQPLRFAEWEWADRGVDETIAKTTPLLAKDPVAASEELQQRARTLEGCGFRALT